MTFQHESEPRSVQEVLQNVDPLVLLPAGSHTQNQVKLYLPQVVSEETPWQSWYRVHSQLRVCHNSSMSVPLGTV